MNFTSLSQDIESLLAAAGENSAAHPAFGAAEPDVAALVRLGAALRLDFHRVLALLLKHECERALAQAPAGDPAGAQGSAVDLRLLRKRFNPDAGVLYAALAEGRYVPNGFAYDARSLRDTVLEMTLLDLHRVATDSPELRAFAERGQRTQALMQDCADDIERAFGSARRRWLALQEELGERLLYLERRRLDNENVIRSWMATFGADHVELAEQAARVDGLQQRIDLKSAQPDLARDELERRLAQADAGRRSELDRLRFRLAVARVDPARGEGRSASAEEIGEYRRQSKQALREIWLLIHPDRLAVNAQAAGLTEAQRELLRDLWHRAMAVRAEEMGFEPGYLGHDYRSLSLLQDILATVRAVLGNAGIDSDVNLVVQGDTVEQQLDWLRGSIDRLQRELDDVQAELLVLLQDAKVQEYAAMLAAAPAQQERVRQEIRSRAAALAAQAGRMSACLERMFDTQAAPA
jgi:hypothetical protein